MTILEEDSEDFKERTTLLIQKTLIDLQTLLVLVTKDLLHLFSWSQVTSYNLMNISNSKVNQMKLIFNILLLYSSHPTTFGAHNEFELLSSHVHDE